MIKWTEANACVTWQKYSGNKLQQKVYFKNCIKQTNKQTKTAEYELVLKCPRPCSK